MPNRASARAARAAVRRGVQRASGAASSRYRTAVLEQSRWLPAYLVAVDAADVAMRTARRVRRAPAAAPTVALLVDLEPGVPTVRAAALSGADELSLVLAGPTSWLQSVGGVALVSGADSLAPADVLVDRRGADVRLSAPLPPDLAVTGRWRIVPTDATGGPLAPTTTAPEVVPDGTPRATGLEVENGSLTLVRVADTDGATVEHRVSVGIARISVDWAPPAGSAPELLLQRADGTVAARLAGSPARDGRSVAHVDATTLDVADTDGDLTVAVAGPDGPVPLVLGLDAYPPLAGAPGHGTARLGATRVRARYDRANRLQVQVLHTA